MTILNARDELKRSLKKIFVAILTASRRLEKRGLGRGFVNEWGNCSSDDVCVTSISLSSVGSKSSVNKTKNLAPSGVSTCMYPHTSERISCELLFPLLSFFQLEKGNLSDIVELRRGNYMKPDELWFSKMGWEKTELSRQHRSLNLEKYNRGMNSESIIEDWTGKISSRIELGKVSSRIELGKHHRSLVPMDIEQMNPLFVVVVLPEKRLRIRWWERNSFEL